MEEGLDRRNVLKAAIGAAIGGTALASNAEAADKKLNTMTGPERLDALEDATTQLLGKIKELKAYNLQHEEGRPIPDLTGITMSKEVHDRYERMGKILRGVQK